MLHQDNSRVQKTGDIRGFGDGYQLSCRIEQPDRAARWTSRLADGFDETGRRVRRTQVSAKAHVCHTGLVEGD